MNVSSSDSPSPSVVEDEELDEELLIKLPIKELNQELKQRSFNKSDIKRLKKSRRTYKNRSYAKLHFKNKDIEMLQLGEEVSNMRKQELQILQDLDLKSFKEAEIRLEVVKRLLAEIDDYAKSNNLNLSDSDDG